MNSYIHLIRHGITAGNENRWYYGRMDIPLTARGIAQLEKLRADGIYPNVQNADCYTSGMLRTEQTFQTIYGRPAAQNAAVTARNELRRVGGHVL